jgi:hypothetical protein
MAPDSRKLQFGPYRTPRFKYGQKVLCEARGEVKILRLSSGRIPWPMGTNGNLGQLSLVLYGDLARAVRAETNAAVCHHWGVSRFSVSKWRKALGVGHTEGTTRWRVAFGKSPEAEKFIKAMATKARDPVRLAKIGAAKRGKPRSAATIAKIRKANTGKRHTAETRAKMSAQRKGKVRPPWLNPGWSDAENELLRTLPTAEVVRQTGRTLRAVYNQRQRLAKRRQS